MSRGPSVYPRWRGELRSRADLISEISGLSPLARGTLSNQRYITVADRFIPAGAGNSSLTYIIFGNECGLSPLARGTPSKTQQRQTRIRFIPAGAGNSCSWVSQLAKIAVYPRWRGELTDDVKDPLLTTGLSPLARGTHC